MSASASERTTAIRPRPASTILVRRLSYASLAFAALAVVALFTIDAAVATRVHQAAFSEHAKQAFRAMRMPGNYVFVAAIVVLLWLTRRLDKRGVVFTLAASAIASLTTIGLKFVIGRLRPFRGDVPFDFAPFGVAGGAEWTAKNLSCPSGDATLAFAAAAALVLTDAGLSAPALAFAAVTALTRVLQGAHYASDVLFGAAVGTATAALLARWARFGVAHRTILPSP